MPSTLRLLTVPLALAVLLLTVSTTHAAPPLPGFAPLALEDEFEEELEAAEEGKFVEGECEIAEEELEEGVLTPGDVEALCAEAEAGTGAASSAGKCPLRSTNGHAAIKGNKLKLTIGYTAFEPVNATIEVRNGSIQGAYKRHLGHSGVLRFTKPLRGKKPKKRTEVHIKLMKGGAGCPSRRLVLFPR
jgi:hypothetical protein